MENVLKQLSSEKALVAIYTNRSDYDKFAVGFILAVADERIIIHSISPGGDLDGYTMMNLKKVYRVETEGLYLKKIRKLCELKGFAKQIYDHNISGDILENAIKYAMTNNQLVTISLDRDANSIIGYIVDYDNNIVKLLQVSAYGENDGYCMLSTQEIEEMIINDSDCRDIDLLYKDRYNSE